MTLAILILAAGASSRMRGADKMLEDIDGVPLIRRQAEMALLVSDQVYVTLPSEPHPRHQVLEDINVVRINVHDAKDGMSASLKAGIQALSETTEHVLVVLGDLPELTADDLQQVIESKSKHPKNLIWRGATKDSKPGHPILFDRSLFPDITKLSGDVGAQPIISAHKDQVHLVPLPNDHALMDLDTPEDWALWRARR